MLRTLFALALAGGALSTLAASQPQGAVSVEIDVSNFKFAPATIALQHNRAYVLHFVNENGGGHNFVARTFFAAATVAPEDRHLVSNGGSTSATGKPSTFIWLRLPRGRYEAHCSHFMHSTFGMTAAIVVS